MARRRLVAGHYGNCQSADIHNLRKSITEESAFVYARPCFAVTASDDKSAQIWDIATGRLLQVLRPPQGTGSEGSLQALAMSPDGTLADREGVGAVFSLFIPLATSQRP